MATPTDPAILGIFIMAAIASVIAFAIVATLILIRSDRRDWPLLGLCFLLQLPVSWLMLGLVREPLSAWIQGLPVDRFVKLLLNSVTAPLAEEPAKLLPLVLLLLLGGAIGKLTRDNATRVGLALGLGFGIGEIWMLAGQIADNAAAAKLPWYVFTGFLLERVPVVFLHGAVVALTLWFWVRGAWWGIFVAMAVHYLLNLPIFLAVLGLFGNDRALFVNVSLLWVYILTIVLAVVMVRRLYRGPTASPCAPQQERL